MICIIDTNHTTCLHHSADTPQFDFKESSEVVSLDRDKVAQRLPRRLPTNGMLSAGIAC
jgi:hypothetical protein